MDKQKPRPFGLISPCLSTAVLTAPGQATAMPSWFAGSAAGGNPCKGDKSTEMANLAKMADLYPMEIEQSLLRMYSRLFFCLFTQGKLFGGDFLFVWVCFLLFYCIAFIVLLHARIKSYYKGEYGAETFSSPCSE